MIWSTFQRITRTGDLRGISMSGAGALCLLALIISGGCGNGAAADAAGGSGKGAAARTDDESAIAPNDTPLPAAMPAPAPKPTASLPEDASCITAECHAQFEQAPYIHGAVAAGDCTVCHEVDQGDHYFPLKREGNEACAFCHTTGSHRMYQHEAMEIGCVACHDPHTSGTKFLLTAPTVREVCLLCHVADDDPFPHGPFADGSCTVCHRPHESNFRHLMRSGDGPEHCFTCHTNMALTLKDAPYVHDPAVDECVNCHDPHASAHEFALRTSMEETCYTCHTELEQFIADATSPHAAVSMRDGCANCHNAHAAGQPALLHDREDGICLQCHDEEIETAGGRTVQSMQSIIGEREFLHGPVRAGECSPCHNAHGATHSRLLRDPFSSEFYAPFDLGDYALCFDCHVSELVLAERTTTLTGFRNADVNLHYVHVNRDRKGRTCRTCHDLHGSNLPRHLADSVPFEGSGWAMPIGFESTETGGSCSPGCHEPQTYRRDDLPRSSSKAPSGGAS